MYNRDLAGTRYSPLTQINATNASKLVKAWSYRFNRDGKTISGQSASELYQEITPIVVNGVMYLPSGDRVVALEPETGKEIWSYEVPNALASFRGVAYWAGDRNNPPRIIFTTGRKNGRPQGEDRKNRPRLRQGRLRRSRSPLRRHSDHL